MGDEWQDFKPVPKICRDGADEWICWTKLDAITDVSCDCGKFRCCLENDMSKNGGALLLLIWFALAMFIIVILGIWVVIAMTRDRMERRRLHEKQLSKLRSTFEELSTVEPTPNVANPNAPNVANPNAQSARRSSYSIVPIVNT